VFLDERCDKVQPIPLNQYWAAYIYVDDIATLEAQFRGRGVEIVRGPETAPYGLKESDVRDPDGHIIGFAEDLKPGPDGPGL